MLENTNTKTNMIAPRSQFNDLPNHLRRYRHMRHLRLRDVAKLLGILNIPHVAHWEKGRKTPTLRNALKLSAAIGVPVEVLFSDTFNRIRKEVHERRNRYNIRPKYD